MFNRIDIHPNNVPLASATVIHSGIYKRFIFIGPSYCEDKLFEGFKITSSLWLIDARRGGPSAVLLDKLEPPPPILDAFVVG